MNVKQKILTGCSLFLPAVAVGVVLASQAVKADSGICWYAGQQYSQGACELTACSNPDKAQRCNYDGTWGNCAWCDEPPI